VLPRANVDIRRHLARRLRLRKKSGEGSCFMRERVDDHSIISCAETPDLSADEYSKQDLASTGGNAL
jgi:hypothetical protein